MYQQEKCASCHTVFTQSNLARIIPNCGHNICSNCHKNLLSTQATSLYCDECKETHDVDEDDLQSFPKNISIIKQLRESSLSASLTSEAVAEKKMSSDETDNSGSLLISASPLRATMQKCPMHSKPLQIICKVDKELLCANCALFGQHRNHDLKTLEEFQQQIDNLKATFKDVKSRKKNADSSVKGQQFRSKIIQQITKKKDELIVDIRSHFAQLINLIKDAESKIYDQLVQAFRNIDSQISKTTKQQHYLESVYDRWFKNAYNHMASIDNTTDINRKINLIYDPNLNLEQGVQCVREIEEKNNNIKETVKMMIDSIRMEYSVSMEGYIYNYARVNYSPVQLTSSQHLINMAPQSPDFNQEYKKKPVKAEFVKSDAIYSINQPQEKSISRKNITSPIRQGVVSPNSKIRPSFKQPSRDGGKKLPRDMKKNDNTPKKHYENLDFAERMLNEFRKSTQTLDLTGCDLTDTDILHVVEIAAEQKPIKCMKVSKNKLTNAGLSRMLEFMENATNINVSYNSLTDEAVDEFIIRRQKMPNLRIINLSHNKLNERKVKSKVEELKRMGIIATL